MKTIEIGAIDVGKLRCVHQAVVRRDRRGLGDGVVEQLLEFTRWHPDATEEKLAYAPWEEVRLGGSASSANLCFGARRRSSPSGCYFFTLLRERNCPRRAGGRQASATRARQLESSGYTARWSCPRAAICFKRWSHRSTEDELVGVREWAP